MSGQTAVTENRKKIDTITEKIKRSPNISEQNENLQRSINYRAPE